MPCSKSSITKTYKCDKDGCLCIPTNGAARVCLSVNETGYIVRCDCKCDTKCECNENCTCINTAGLTCICVCRDQNGRIKTCEDCSCRPKQAQTQSCKGKSNVTCCCNTGNEKCACLNCSCCEPGKNKCGKSSCVTVCKAKKAESGCECNRKSTCACNGSACKSKQVDGSFKDRNREFANCSGNCDEKCRSSCVEQNDAFKANVCARKVCSENCKCQGNANSCVCICKNKQEETVCCDDCKCDGNKTCDKKECICVRKESSCKCKLVEKSCCGSCDEKCKCSGRTQEATSKAKNCSNCSGNCKCQGNTNSCVCVCKDKQGKNVCCDDCKCDGDNRCDKEGCVCMRKESTWELMKPNCCENCDAKCNCFYVEQNTDINAKNYAGKASGENCKCQGNANSCVCICKNKQGETVCCDDCKCDNNNICDKKECVCVPKEDSRTGQPVKPNCCENCDTKCKCSCVDQGAASNANSCTGKVCAENCKCQGNGNSCVCICKDKQGKSICCDDCKCDGNNTCDKKGCVCVPKGTMTCRSGCCCRNAVRFCVCKRKNMQGLVCCDDCKCDGTKTCDRKGCICVREESSCKSLKTNCCENCEKCKFSCLEQNTAIKVNTCARKACGENCKCQENTKSCVCICKNKQGEIVCCDDCKCDNNNICEKKGCVCVLKEHSCKAMKSNCCGNCDVKCKCSCVDQRAVSNSYAGKLCAENCKCKGNGNSCVCICMNKQGESICCDDCKCDNNNICDKKACVCIRKESSCKCKPVKSSCCGNCNENCKCCCVDHEAVFKTNICDRKACSGNCKCQRYANCKCLGNANSCVCICKNKQGETICCEDCNCDVNNRCDKNGCACIPGASVTCNKKAEAKCCC